MLRNILFLFVIFHGHSFAGTYDDLIKAGRMGDTATLTALFQRGVDPNSTDISGNTLLTIAANEGHTELVRLLIANKAKLNARNLNGETALQLAAYRGYEPIVHMLLAAGASTDTPGWPPLIYAIIAKQETIARALLTAGASPDAIASNGQTALMFAIEQISPSLVSLLIEAGANPDISTPRGETAYSLALKSQDNEIQKMVAQALEKRAEARQRELLNIEPAPITHNQSNP